jgi:uridylate kinase
LLEQTSPKRLMVKLSGEMLGGAAGQGFDGEALELVAGELKDLIDHGKEVAVVIGGGNIFRGMKAARDWEIDRASADYMGMLATVINGLALQAVLESKYKLNSRVMTAINMSELAEPYIRRKAIKHLEKQRVVIFAGGTGNPYFTTDTAASLRAREIHAEIVLKATKVDGVYNQDPANHPDATKFKSLEYFDVISKKLHVMDATAVTMCMDGQLPILVFKMDHPGCVLRALQNHDLGTIVR